MSGTRAPAPPEPPFAGADPIGAWLDVLVRLLRVPARERGEIRDELESHLRERVRDLMLAGHGEDHATTRAIAELGEAAQLAERFREARSRPFFRRHAMNLSILTVAGAAAVMSIVAVTNSVVPSSRPPARAPGSGGEAGRPALVDDLPVVASLFAAKSAGDLDEVSLLAEFSGTTLERVLAALAGAAGLPSIVRWEAFESAGIPRDHDINLAVGKPLRAPTILRLLNEALDARDGSRIEYRVSDGVLEFAPRMYFDRREVVVIGYDLAPITAAKGVDGEDVVRLIIGLVERDNWVDNGGDIASAHSLADRLFISAPPRMHEQVSWILRQLGQPAAPAGAAAAPAILDAFGNPVVEWATTSPAGPVTGEHNVLLDVTGRPATAR